MVKKKLILILCAVGIIFSMKTKVMAADSMQRIGGSDRYDTAIQVSKNGWIDGSKCVVLANGENFPDALSAAPLAKKYNAPILLTMSSGLDSRVEGELKRLNVKQVFIIGGTGVIPISVEKKLSDLDIKTIRLYGQDRYETAIKVAEQLGFNGELAVANGESFPDAVSMAPIAAEKFMPIILTPSDKLPDSVTKYIKDKNITKTYVIGGNDVVSNDIFNSMPSAERLYGDSRYDTNIAVLKKFQNELNFDKIYMANGENFPDALAGSALAAKDSSCVLLVSDYIGLATKKFSFDKLPSVKNTEILGGNGVVPDSLVNKVLHPDEDEVLNLKLYTPVVRQGEWVYYSTSVNGSIGLFKCKTDGTSKTKLSDNSASQITVSGDYIYYISSGNFLYRIKTDGTSETKIGESQCSWFRIMDNKVYASTITVSSAVCNFNIMDLDGSNKVDTAIPVNGRIVDPTIVGDYIYYIEEYYRDEPITSKIYKIKTDGSEKVQISSEDAPKIAHLKVYDNWLYYVTDSNDGKYSLKKVKLDGTEKTNILENSSLTFDISDGWIYYINNNAALHKIKIDGTEDSQLENTIVSHINFIEDGWIYYNVWKNNGYDEYGISISHKVRLDGTDDIIIN